MTPPLLIALDADGVLLNYNDTFGMVWSKITGETISCVEPRAYHATNYWGIPKPSKDHPFWEAFDKDGWKSMPAMEGAVEACQMLVDAGHKLVCVTSMPVHRQAERLANLQALGFPIDEVIATGHCEDPTRNPKKDAIEALAPDWFVDDELRKLKDLPLVKCVLVDPAHPDSPNTGQENDFIEYRVGSLLEFAHKLTHLPKISCSKRV